MRILKTLEGRPFDTDTQVEFQILLIQHRLYKPSILTKAQNRLLSDVEKKISYETASIIFHSQNYEDPPMRGRNSVAPLNKMGFCVAKQRFGAVTITTLGNYFLNDDYEMNDLFLKYFLKWQLPNPIEPHFSKKANFAVKPFVATLHLVDCVNNICKQHGYNSIGISKEEFSRFVPTLIHYKDIEKQAINLVNLRHNKVVKRYVDSNLLVQRSIPELTNTLSDYGDNAIRYFRFTGFITIRGDGYYIDLEPRRSVEIDMLLKADNASPLNFSDYFEYLNYLNDLSKPELPWETKQYLKIIANDLHSDIQESESKLTSCKQLIPDLNVLRVDDLELNSLKEYTNYLRTHRKLLDNLVLKVDLLDVVKIEQCIKELKNINRLSGKPSIELERLLTLALHALDDAVDVCPNYPVGDDNKPTFTAPANKPDIECVYRSFYSICEVTMLTGSRQWHNEGYSVPRHLRDYEEKFPEKEAYCLFVAPKIHRDTAETFWNANKHGYIGKRQKIVPISISQTTTILECLLKLRKLNKSFTHVDLLNLYNEIIEVQNIVDNSEAWICEIPSTIANWTKSLLDRY